MAKNKEATPAAGKNKRAHKATFAKDKRKGGYLIRVEGPSSNMFAGREVPVSLRDGTEHTEKLESLIWTGKDKESGLPVTLYSFIAKPREASEVDAEF